MEWWHPCRLPSVFLLSDVAASSSQSPSLPPWNRRRKIDEKRERNLIVRMVTGKVEKDLWTGSGALEGCASISESFGLWSCTCYLCFVEVLFFSLTANRNSESLFFPTWLLRQGVGGCSTTLSPYPALAIDHLDSQANGTQSLDQS